MTPSSGARQLLVPRRVSYVKVGLGLLLLLGLIAGIWYVYTAQQTRTVAGHPPGTSPKPIPSPGAGISTEKLKYEKPKVEPAAVIVPAAQNGTPPDDASYINGLVKRIGELEAQVNTKVAQVITPTKPVASPSKAPTPPNPALAVKGKALAESRKAPLVVIRTTAKDEDVTEGARTLQPGWKIPFLVETAINSDIGGEFVARVSETVYASGRYQLPLIPSGATVMGSTAAAKLVPGNERLPMMGVTLSIPQMKPVDLGSLPIMDEQGQLGMVDDINHHYVRLGAMVLLRGAVNGATRVIQSETRAIGPVGELGASMAQGTNQAANQQIQTYDVRPTIKVMKGSRGYILVTKPLTIPRIPGGMD